MAKAFLVDTVPMTGFDAGVVEVQADEVRCIGGAMVAIEDGETVAMIAAGRWNYVSQVEGGELKLARPDEEPVGGSDAENGPDTTL